jgi:hypothetical protein
VRYPKEWTADSATQERGGPRTSEYVNFKDASGKGLLTISLDFTGYDFGWPVQRTVIESGDLPGLAAGGWTPPLKYAFFAEESTGGMAAGAYCTLKVVNEVPPDGPGMLRGLPPQSPPTPGVAPSGPEQYGPGWNGPYFISVELSGSVELCGSVAGARTWWASPEGQQVKAVATSLTAG